MEVERTIETPNTLNTENVTIELKSGDQTPDSGIGGVSTPTSIMDVNCDGSRLGSGPDLVIETDRIMTSKGNEAVKLNLDKTGPGAYPPISIPTMFKRTCMKIPNKVAMMHKVKGEYRSITYKQYYDDVMLCAKAMIKVGLQDYHGVGIIGFNSPEWFIADLAAIHAGGFAVGIYTTNSPEACQYVASNCEANIIVVENDIQLQKILQVKSQLPHLKAIVQYTGELKEKYENCYTWKDFLQLGKSISTDNLDAKIKVQAPNKCCTLIYTSGTTGNPKGVMVSHDNVSWTSRMTGEAATARFGEEVIVSYLPLSHIAAQILDIHLGVMYGTTVYFAQPDALKGTLGQTLKEARPTIFLGVPRVWEKMQEKMKEVGKSSTGMKKKIATWAKGVGLKGNMSLMNGGSTPFGWTIASVLFKKIHTALGLDRCRFCLTGAAPIMRETLEYFMSLNLPLMELYGMSENTGPHSVSFPWKYRMTSVGTELPGCITKLDQADADGNGEICMKGRHVFMGYLNMEEKTKEALDEQGWLHSGDVGKKDKDGFLFITGRIKELLITAGGENVAPVPIEDTVKEMLPCVSNCMLIGDKRKFLSMLITIKTDVDTESTMPLDKLTTVAHDWAKEHGSSSKTVSEILDNQDAKFLKGIQDGIDRANKKSVSNAQRVQKWSILPRDFSIPGGELGPTLKLKRPVVTKMYANTIEALYA